MELIFKNRVQIVQELTLIGYPEEVTPLSGPGTDCVETVMEARMESLASRIRLGTRITEGEFTTLARSGIDLLRVNNHRYPNLPIRGLQAFADLLWEKHQAYGAKPLLKWGSSGVAIRLDSKIERYFTLSKAQRDSMGDESLADTIQDFIGYCAIGARMIRDNRDGGNYEHR